MAKYRKYPVLEADLEAVRNNAEVMCRFCGERGISVAGVTKFSDGDLKIARAYHDGGCSQIASSRTVQLKKIKKAMPDAETMLIRIPMISEAEEVVRWCDISLNSEESVLRKLDKMAAKHGKEHRVMLMLDVGDRREGVYGIDELCRLAKIVEEELSSLKLAGVGASFACVSGVLPDWNNLSELAEGARRVEEIIGRKLDMVSGGSSITLTMLAAEKPLPPEINHLRIGGSIANPISIRNNRGVVIDGMRADTFTLTAEIVEVADKPSAAPGSGKNWAGQAVKFEDRGIRRRAIIALGSQDIGDAHSLIPMDEGVSVIAGSSDHTVLDVTDSIINWKAGDKMSFRVYYMPLLYCFSTRNVSVKYI